MKESTKKKLKKGCIVGGVIVGAAVVVTAGFVLLHKPKQGIPCRRSVMRADGVPKKAYNSASRANMQSIAQFVCHGEVCHPYEINGKFYTGHRNIRPAKFA